MRPSQVVLMMVALLVAGGAFVALFRELAASEATDPARKGAPDASPQRPKDLSADPDPTAAGGEPGTDAPSIRRDAFSDAADPANRAEPEPEPTLAGRVVGPDGRPRTAAVTLYELPEGAAPGSGRPAAVDAAAADENGMFKVSVFRTGRHRLVAVAEDGASATADLSTEAFPVGFVLRLGAPPGPTRAAAGDVRPLRGRVVRRDTEEPLARVKVVGRRADAVEGEDPSTAYVATTTDDDGRFVVDVAPGRWKMRAEPRDEAATAEVDAEPDGPPATVLAERPWRIAVRAVRADGRAVPRARLRSFFDSPRGVVAGPERTARSPVGRFELAGTVAVRLAVEIEAPGSPPVALGSFDVNAGETILAKDVVIDDGWILTGTVADAAGLPFPFAAVRAVRGFGAARVATADAAGVFVLDRVARDVAAVVVEHGDAVEPRRFPPSSPTGAAVVELGALILERGGAIEGVVRRKDGSIDAAAVVQAIEQAVRPGGRRSKEAATDALGRYRIGGLGGGDWRVRALKRDGGFATDEADRGLAPPKIVTVVPSRSTLLDL